MAVHCRNALPQPMAVESLPGFTSRKAAAHLDWTLLRRHALQASHDSLKSTLSSLALCPVVKEVLSCLRPVTCVNGRLLCGDSSPCRLQTFYGGTVDVLSSMLCFDGDPCFLHIIYCALPPWLPELCAVACWPSMLCGDGCVAMANHDFCKHCLATAEEIVSVIACRVCVCVCVLFGAVWRWRPMSF